MVCEESETLLILSPSLKPLGSLPLLHLLRISSSPSSIKMVSYSIMQNKLFHHFLNQGNFVDLSLHFRNSPRFWTGLPSNSIVSRGREERKLSLELSSYYSHCSVGGSKGESGFCQCDILRFCTLHCALCHLFGRDSQSQRTHDLRVLFKSNGFYQQSALSPGLEKWPIKCWRHMSFCICPQRNT